MILSSLIFPSSLKSANKTKWSYVNILDIRPLRHTHTTLLLEKGANIKDIQKRLGHSKLSTTMDTYSHVTDKMKNATVYIFETISKALSPETLIIEIPPSPKAVAMAQIVSKSFIICILRLISYKYQVNSDKSILKPLFNF